MIQRIFYINKNGNPVELKSKHRGRKEVAMPNDAQGWFISDKPDGPVIKHDLKLEPDFVWRPMHEWKGTVASEDVAIRHDDRGSFDCDWASDQRDPYARRNT